MKLSILIPVYNEASTIGEVLHQVIAVDLLGITKEVIVVDDGSTDQTAEILRREQQQHAQVLTIYTSPTNFGKGSALRTAMKYATGDLILIQDADLEVDPREYAALLKPILSGQTQVVYGSRFLHPTHQIPWCSRFARFILTTLTNWLYGASLTDEATAYKVFRADVLKGLSLQCVGFEFCPEVTAKLLKRGERIIEVPIAYRPRTKAEGKKLRYIHDGLLAIWTLLKYRVTE